MHYRPRGNAALHIALGGLPPKMPVDVDADVGVRAKTVADLRKVAAWPDNLVVSTPPGERGEGCVKVSRVHAASRTTPKA
ncbi:MAG TPA: hypothetical protein VFB45_10240 [Pseudolabrys sp.]|nr:hypothetical protein [Pseudolabrys sp.]